MTKLIALILLVGALFGLYVGVINPQISGAKASAEKISVEQEKINRMVNNPNVVSGGEVNSHLAHHTGYTVSVQNTNGVAVAPQPTSVDAGGLYEKSITYDVNGNVDTMTFKQVDLKR